ncbi:MAG: glycosyltransferase family 4 protein [Candidatus Schekmanbacteria bacterium]|nr:glycosyltransferase family 4 protein [Candidatus Schekmanbacteria bacterium]
MTNMDKIKVVHIITRLDRGGSAENTLLTVIGLNKARYEVSLISGCSQNPPQILMNQLAESGIKFIVINDLVREISPWRDIKAMLTIRRLIRGADIVHTHTSKAGIVGRWAAFAAKVPHTVHTPHGHVFYGYYNRIITRFFILLERISASVTDKIICLTKKEAEDYTTLGIGGLQKYMVIHSGVKLDNFRATSDSGRLLREKLHIPLQAKIVGSLGRLEEVKGYKYFVEAASVIADQFPAVYFLLAGDGARRAELSEQCNRRELQKRFIFYGWQEDAATVMSVMDIFILPSLNEGMGRVLVEAMSMGKPIVATAVGGVPELIKHEQNGILVPPKDAQALACAVTRLLKNPELADKIASNTKRDVDQYSAQKMLEKIEGLYEQMLVYTFKTHKL